MSPAAITPCPSCGETRFKPIFEKRGRRFCRCLVCRLERQDPLPSSAEIAAYYENHYSSGRLRPMLAETAMISLRMRRRFAEVMPHLDRAGRWLDVGCSDGAFIREARTRGVNASGIELASPAVVAAQAQGLPVTQGRIEDFSDEQGFEAVTAFDVLEHVPNPAEFLAHCRRLLRDGGRLAVSVPNLSSWSRRLMRKRWYFYIPDGHLHYFTPANLKQLLAAAGFRTLSTKTLFKAVTLTYSLSQLQELNPVLNAFARGVHAVCPTRLAEKPLPLPLGEMLVIAEKNA